MKRGKESSNWANLPPELMSLIFLRLSVFDILFNAQKVCKSWYDVAKDPFVWKKIDLGFYNEEYDLARICRHVVDSSQGGLVGIKLGNFCSDSLLTYISDRSSSLRSLEMEMSYRVTGKGLADAVAKLPSFEELELWHPMVKLDLEAIGQSCPKLKTLKIIFSSSKPSWIFCENNYAIDIAMSMPGLRHLQLCGHGLNNAGLNAILDGCPHLEYLDFRMCINIMLSGDLEKRCSERIKVLRRVDDSTDDLPNEIEVPPPEEDFFLAYVDVPPEDDFFLAYGEELYY